MLTVVYDSCVLYSAMHRDLLMFLASQRFFRACWSNKIHEEWIRSVLRTNPNILRERLEQTRSQMDRHSDDCLIERFEYLIDSLYLPDPDDRHVLAAAIHAEASRIVTFNIKHFPKTILSSYQIKAQTPDEFIMDLTLSYSDDVLEAVKAHRQNLKNPSKTVEEYLATLSKRYLSRTAVFLSEHTSEI